MGGQAQEIPDSLSSGYGKQLGRPLSVGPLGIFRLSPSDSDLRLRQHVDSIRDQNIVDKGWDQGEMLQVYESDFIIPLSQSRVLRKTQEQG